MVLFLASGGGLLAFEGWLLKINETVFPNELIALESYKCTPDQIMDLDPYRDGNGELHRNALPHTATNHLLKFLLLEKRWTWVGNGFHISKINI